MRTVPDYDADQHLHDDPLERWREYSLPLADGRQLGIAEFGPADGFPVLWFHGTPGARKQVPPPAVDHAFRAQVRIVSVERPGVGESTPHHYDHVIDFAADVNQVLQQLALDRVGLIGLSGGGPYVLAVCAHLPDRVVAAAVLGGVGPGSGPEQVRRGGLVPALGRAAPLLTVLREPAAVVTNTAMRIAVPVIDRVFDAYMTFGPRSDRKFLARPEMRAMFLDDLVSSGRRSFRAVAYDVVLFSRRWGFDLADIQTPVYLWHGDADLVIPISHGHRMAALIPNSRLSVVSGEGHLAMLDAAAEAIDLIMSHAGEM